MKYRADIDGLRAIAILPVIFFHAGFETLGGGFLGVDIFFVISGYLITSILLKELENNKFSILNFYERRARRILPALFFVLIITSLVAYIFMPAPELKEYAQSLVAVVSFLSNIFFYLEVDYFATSSEQLPLLHTWSLSIEEQFYLFFPILLLITWRFNKKFILKICVVLLLLSLCTNIYFNTQSLFEESFYLLPSRAWELLAGSITAILSIRVKPFESDTITDLSFFTIILMCVLFPENANHPGIFTLLVVIPTCLILLTPSPNSISYKILTTRLMVYIGGISYSLYIWHQPVFAFLRLKSVGHINLLEILVALALTTVLSIFTYRYIETPFRSKEKFSRNFIFTLSFLGTILIGAFGLYIHYNNGLPERFNKLPKIYNLESISPKRESCRYLKGTHISPHENCEYLGEKVQWAAIGDSHIIEPAYALATLLEPDNIGIKHFSYGGCSPALSYDSNSNESCLKWITSSVDYIIASPKIKNVLINFRYTSYIRGDNIYDYPNVTNKTSKAMQAININNVNKAVDFFWIKLEKMIQKLNEANKTIYILTPVPELPTHINKVVSGFHIFSDKTLLNVNLTTSKDYYIKRHSEVLDKFKILDRYHNLHIINSFDYLCNDDGCPAVINNQALYFDDDHLNLVGAEHIIHSYFKGRKSL